jgi:hypothetical protein
MKRYIAAVLIPCLLLQLCGCYSQREISIEELMKYKDEEITIMKNDSVKYLLKAGVTSEEIIIESKTNYCIGIDTTKEDLMLYKKAIIKNEGEKAALKIDTVKINKMDVLSIQKSELDEANTTILVLGIIAGVALIAYAIAMASFQLDFSGMNLFGGQRF